jgi:hypothetical protein
MNSIFFLEELGLLDASRVGEEAANLGELLRKGVPVSSAFVIPTTSYAEYLNYPSIKAILGGQGASDPEELKAGLLSASLPKILEQSLRLSYRALSGSRDTFVSVRNSLCSQPCFLTGMRSDAEATRALGEEELIQAVKKLWSEHLAQLYLSEKEFSLNPLPIIVQQVEQQELGGGLFTSNPHSSDTRVALVEVEHNDGKENLFFEKSLGASLAPSERAERLIKRLAAGAVTEPVPFEIVAPVSSWAEKIEKLLGNPQQLGWGLYRGELNFSWIKPLYLKKRVPGAVSLWVRVHSHKEAVPAEALGLISTTADCAVALAQEFPSKPVLLELEAVVEDEIATFRRAKYKDGLRNLHLILPLVRTADGLRDMKRVIAGEGIRRGPHLKLYFRIAFPANVVLLERFIELEVDGVIFEGQTLAQGLLGTRELVKADDSILWALDTAWQSSRKANLDFLCYGGDLEAGMIADILGRGVTQIVVDASDEKRLLDILSSTEERLLGDKHA